MASGALDLDALDEEWPFEIDDQVGHLFKHPYLGVEDIAGKATIRRMHVAVFKQRLLNQWKSARSS